MRDTSRLTNEIILAVQTAYPAARLWRLNTGAFLNPQGRLVRTGPRGMPDIDGYITIKNYAIRLGIEVKRGRDKLNEAQVNWGGALIAAGGIYIVGRAVDQVLWELDYAVTRIGGEK